ncbi:MAG TPA: amino acid adenylation domain-containing protein, partial [Candidatus Limnocylindrales bacterium]|nr:amino acid adenylation domain-containing protein [Candidatus Limnocylindrales bacterium]
MGAAPGTIHAAFLDCIHAYADTVAVACGGESLTYRELDELSTKLAHRLIDLGVTAEARVGICADPSLSLVVAMLGVVKAGGAYVPLDPQYPAERLTYLITDSGAEIIIVQDGLRDRLPVTAARLLVLDPPWTEIAGEPTSRPPAAADASADSVACVIYTSGSTGAPKGVLITHRGVTNLAAAAAAEFGLGPADRFLQLASISFSAILEEIYPALLSGATVVLAGYQRAIPTFTHFLETLKQQRITGFEITTSYWHQLVEELVCGGRLPDTVRFAVMGGDRVEPERVLAWRAFGVPLIHVYGPTETTATATYYHSGKEIPDPAGVLPIGRAIANTEVHLLDETMRPVAEGMAGELYVGGQALARGYHRAPKATATGFVPDPYGLPGGRLYRTGDLARRRPDGTIEFLGRVDGQIKIRGFRIEPGEVESALRRHPDVGKAVVMPAGQASEDKHLVAYVTRRGAATPEVAPLREHLAAILPAYMIPSAFVILDQIPVSAHGKVDHAALAAIEAPAHTAYVTPKPGTESELAALWAEVLKRVRIGADDDFFALGGTSLQAARIVAKARRRLCAELLPADLLKNPTITRLAQRADELLRGHATTYVPLRQQMAPWLAKRQALSRYLSQRTNHQRGSLTSMSQQNLWLMSKLQPNIPLYNESWSCRLRGELDFAAFTHALAKVFDRHEALRTTFELIDGQAVQLVGGPDGLPLSYHDLLDADPLDRLSTAHRLRDTEICRPLDPRREAVRMQLFRLTPTEHLFVMNIHHLVWDAVSKEVFLQEFMAFYQGYGSTQPPDVPDLPVQYGDFALWQRDHLKGANLERLLGYWRDKLADPAAPLPMPSDRPAPPVQDYDGAKLLVS